MAAEMPQEPRKQVDWEAVEREYRTGQFSTREIARQFDLSDTAIRKRAKAEGWEKDLSERVRKHARAKLVREDGSQSSHTGELQTIEAAAARQVEIVRQHRHAIGRGRDLTLRLMDELDATTSNLGEIETLIESECLTDANSNRRNAMMKAISLPSRAGVIKDLSAAAKNWVTLERQAFSLDDATPSGGIVVQISRPDADL